MFIKTDSKTHIRQEAISAVTFGTHSANVFVPGAPMPFRVTGEMELEMLHILVGDIVKEVPEEVVEEAPDAAEEQTETKSRRKK